MCTHAPWEVISSLRRVRSTSLLGVTPIRQTPRPRIGVTLTIPYAPIPLFDFFDLRH